MKAVWAVTRQTYSLARCFGRGRAFSTWCALQMLLTGYVCRHRIWV